MRVSAIGATDVGRKRDHNEDAFLVLQEEQLFCVADGMGGHSAGEVASKLAIDAINTFIARSYLEEEITWPFGLDETISYEGNRLKTAVRDSVTELEEVKKELGAHMARVRGKEMGLSLNTSSTLIGF